MRGPTVACMTVWLIGIHGGHKPTCPNENLACNCESDCSTKRCDCPEAWTAMSKYVSISSHAKYVHYENRCVDDANIAAANVGAL